MSDGHRAFCMGNALVTGIPHEIGKALVRSLGGSGAPGFARCPISMVLSGHSNEMTSLAPRLLA